MIELFLFKCLLRYADDFARLIICVMESFHDSHSLNDSLKEKNGKYQKDIISYGIDAIEEDDTNHTVTKALQLPKAFAVVNLDGEKTNNILILCRTND